MTLKSKLITVIIGTVLIPFLSVILTISIGKINDVQTPPINLMHFHRELKKNLEDKKKKYCIFSDFAIPNDIDLILIQDGKVMLTSITNMNPRLRHG